MRRALGVSNLPMTRAIRRGSACSMTARQQVIQASNSGRSGSCRKIPPCSEMRCRTVARMGSEDYGLTVSIHPHAAGFVDFEAETERLLGDIDPQILKLCLDTGHSHYAGFDPVAFMKRHRERLAYVHFKDIDPKVRADAVAKRTGFYDACAQGIFCNLGKGMTDFRAVRDLLVSTGYEGWCTVEQDCDPAGPTSPIDDARANRAYLESIDFN